MPSLLDAIEAKYGQDEGGCEIPIGIHVPRYGPRQSIPRLLVLNDCSVETAGDEESLKKTCAGVIEIDLAHNKLTQWSEVSKILQYAPCVSFLNLSFNSLNTPLTSTCVENTFRFPLLPRLSVLILIGTKVSWDAVWFILRHANTLQELHLSLNDYDVVDISNLRGFEERKRTRNAKSESSSFTESESESGNSSSHDGNDQEMEIEFPPNCNRSDSNDSGHGSSSDDEDNGCFPYLRRLMFDGNPINSWEEVAKLGLCFPSIRHLGLADCPLSSIPDDAYQNFENLQSLTISNTNVKEMTDIARLKRFRALTDLRLQGIPLFTEMTAHERRQLLVALLPNVKRLNGGAPISTVEREDAERSYVRRFAQTEGTKPERYYELAEVHGELQPLLDVRFKPATRVKMRVLYENNIFDRHVNVYQTTNELKASLEQLVGLPAAKMRLFYIDAEMREVVGREEMRFPQKQIYSYNMLDGDEIHIEQKQSPVHTPSSNGNGNRTASSTSTLMTKSA